MATFRAIEEAGFAASGRPIDAGALRDLKIVRKTFTLAAQATTDDLRMYLPSGFRPVALRLDPSVTLGTSTLQLGNSGTAAKYRAAAALTAPALAALPIGASAKLAAQEEVIIAIGTASLPASGTLVVEFWGTHD